MSNSTVSDVEAFLHDVATRAAKTFVQAGTAAAGAQWSAAGLNLGHIHDFSSVERTVASVVVAFGSAGASATWNLLKGYWNARKSRLVADVVATVEDAVKPMSAGAAS